MSEIIENNRGIDDTLETNETIETTPMTEEVPSEENAVDEKITGDTEPIEEPVFKRENWSDLVDKFEENYPISREFRADIGECILEDDNLWNDENCLEKALLRVLCEQYTSDSDRANNEEFLQNYIYNNEAIKDKIVGEYMEELDSHKLPASMTRGGRISLANPSRPRSIREAGVLAERMMKR